MSSTLVIILSETRASELTFDNFKKNVIDELNADLCVCIGVKSDYDYDNPYYQLAKYRFTYDEPDDYGIAFDYAYKILSKDKQKYEYLKDTSSLSTTPFIPKQSTKNITFYGNIENVDNIDKFNDDEIVIFTDKISEDTLKNQVYGVKNPDDNSLVICKNVNTYKKPLYWREFLKIGKQYLGGIKDITNQQSGSAGILIFFRWFLLKSLLDNNLIEKYDRFVITRSDFIYQLPHPKLDLLNKEFIWIPDGEQYYGYTDRHVVLSKNNIEAYLNIFNNMVLRSNEYFMKMYLQNHFNLERLIKFHLKQNNVIHLVKHTPYIMYSVRNKNGTTRWKKGIYSNDLGYYIKYESEYDKSTYYKNEYENSGLTIDMFYEKYLSRIAIQWYICKIP